MIKIGMVAALGAGMFASANAAAGLSLYVPHIVEADATGATWTGTFEAPMTVSYNGKLEYAAFCVENGKSCFVEPSSEIVTGEYTDAKEIIPFEVGDLAAGAYSCYIATLLPKSMVCSDPVAFTATAANAEAVQNAEAQAVVPELPVVTDPVFVADDVVDVPAPAVDVQAAAVDAPAPTVDAPAPAVDAPAPTVDAPAPAVDAPAPAVDAPAPTVDVPAPAVDAPVPEAIVETLDAREIPSDVPEEGSVTQGVATFTPLE
ncbi:hypothetical protein M9435_006014 [Picochlorum sp. BPE23]|nr:hypothetical protein M9435_006014 [Picochlorum sp. BPE23]